MNLFSKTTLYYRLPVIALCAAIFWQSSYPIAISKTIFSFQDKILHFLAYAVLSFLTARALKNEKPFWPIKKTIIISAIFASLYGLSDEIHQSFVPSRFCSISDLVADIAGSIAGSFIYKKLLVFYKKA